MGNIPTTTSLKNCSILTAYRVLVTPEMAREWIDAGNVDNRRIRSTVVRRYAAKMERGDWKPTHQGVAFSARRLIDGQHRLLAVIASGASQWMVVFLNQDDDTFGALDRGQTRTLRDDLPINPHIVDGMAWLSRLLMGDGKAAAVDAHLVRDIRGVFEPAFIALYEAASSNVKGRTNAQIRATAALHYTLANDDGKDYILRQWQAWVGLYVSDLSPSMQSGLRRMEAIHGQTGQAAQIERACVSWIMFNPHSRNLQKIILRDKNNMWDEMKSAAARAVAA